MGVGLFLRLKALLTESNVRYLSTMLDMLTTGDAKTYSAFWEEFDERMNVPPGQRRIRNSAWNALKELNSIVKEYRRG